jgi:hypothetical protein
LNPTAELIGEFKPPKGIQVRVLFDSYYLCPTAVKVCQAKGVRFISTLKSNRNLYKNGHKLKVSGYGYSLFGYHRKKSCRIEKSNGSVEYVHVDASWIKVKVESQTQIGCTAVHTHRVILNPLS